MRLRSILHCSYIEVAVLGPLMSLILFSGPMLYAQDQKVADSLIILYESETYQGDKLELLESISEEETKPEEILKYAELLIVNSRADSLAHFRYSGYLQKGNALKQIGDSDGALEAYFESIAIANRAGMLELVGKATISVASLYAELGNSSNASKYFKEGIDILRNTDDQIALASALLNAGDTAFNAGDYTLALEYFDESSSLFEDLDYPIGTAYNLGNIGMVYAEQGKDELAEENISKAVTMLEEMEDYYGISIYLTYMSDIYKRKNDLAAAMNYATQSLELARRKGLISQISDANLLLANLYGERGDSAVAYRFFKDHIVHRDSVMNIEVVEQMADQRTEFEVSRKQVELDLVKQKRKTERIINIATGVALFLIVILAVALYRRYQFIQKTKRIIEEEKERSDRLLLNILPEETAEELKAKGKVKARKYESVTVLFSDFKGFTSYSEGLSPEALVHTIGFYFSKFDEIMEKYDLEKIKTIGDAYMCAGGLHDNKNDHAERMIRAAEEIVEFVDKTRKDETARELTFDIRIGINTGPVVAGVVGTKKFAYDIWGDTVNVAARMESMSEPGRINISENTYDLLKDQWSFDYRGELEVKNRGKLKMYFVNS